MQAVAEVLDRLDELGSTQERVTVDDVQEALGHDAFSPILLILGLLALSPLGDLPGVPAVLGLGIVIVGAQMAAGRQELWMPRFFAKRSIKARRLRQTAKLFRPVVSVLGVIIWSRLTFLVEGTFARAIAATCVLLALTLPPLEVVPFGATVPSVVITSLAMALVAKDGLLALISVALLLGGAYLLYQLIQ